MLKAVMIKKFLMSPYEIHNLFGSTWSLSGRSFLRYVIHSKGEG